MLGLSPIAGASIDGLNAPQSITGAITLDVNVVPQFRAGFQSVVQIAITPATPITQTQN